MEINNDEFSNDQARSVGKLGFRLRMADFIVSTVRPVGKFLPSKLRPIFYDRLRQAHSEEREDIVEEFRKDFEK